MKRSKLPAVLGVILFTCVAAFAIFAQTLKPGSTGVDGSASSIAPHGRRALFLLLESLGFRAELWSSSPALLPRGENILWMAKAPKAWGVDERDADALATHENDKDESDSGESDQDASGSEASAPNAAEPTKSAPELPSALDRHALAHYRRFAEEGGTIILPWNHETQKFLVHDLGLAEFESIESEAASGAALRTVVLSTGEACTLERPSSRIVPFDEFSSEKLVLWTGVGEPEGEADVIAFELPLGVGGIVVLAGDAWLDNEKVRSRDHALLAVRLVQEFDRGGLVLFDEYALGLWTPETASGLAFSGRLWLLTANLALLFLFFVWRHAWVGTFARDPVTTEHVSALSRARVLSGLLQRAGRYSVLARALRVGVVRSIAARFGDRRGRAHVPEDETREWLAALRAQGATDLDRWGELLAARAPRDAHELDVLERDLRGLELRWKDTARARILSR